MGAAFLQALRACLGDANVLVDGDLDAYAVDWRRRYRGRPLAVARPAGTAEVAEVVRLCAAHAVPIVPQGGNSGLVGGGVPDAGGTQLVLSLKRLQRVRAIDVDNLTATVEAGCVLQSLHDAAEAHGLLFPLRLGSQGSCTLGGNLSSNAGGTQVLRYGNARDLCLGLEVVTAAGEVWDGLSGLRKDNSGYDLRDLFIGSEGTLGIITAATMKLYPRPGATLTALAACPGIDAAIGLLRLARARLDAGLTGFEVMGEFALRLQARHFPQLRNPLPAAPWTVLMELAANRDEEAQAQLEGLLGEASVRCLAADAVVAANAAQARELWQLREAIPLAQAREGLNIKHDIALPVSAIPGFLGDMDASLRALVPGLQLVVFGHLGDGNLHYNLQAPDGMPPAEFLQRHETTLTRHVHDAVLGRGGSFAAEHGIGALKAAELAARKSPVALAMMRALKHALDPHGLLNPGRVLASP
ncbi:MAG: FAD-binding oxidoreductase [Xanthomonadales bacterium]|nr:FAD-binding oxidoreductase [Xanthomonadales bacterium]